MAKFRIIRKYDYDVYDGALYFPEIKVFGFIWWPLSFGKLTEEMAMDVIKAHVESTKTKEMPKPKIMWEGEF